MQKWDAKKLTELLENAGVVAAHHTTTCCEIIEEFLQVAPNNVIERIDKHTVKAERNCNTCYYWKDESCDNDSSEETYNSKYDNCSEWILKSQKTDHPGMTKSGQNEQMKFDPSNGSKEPYPSHADQYREWHGAVAWLFNPWAGNKRDPRDIGSDVLGYLISCKGF